MFFTFILFFIIVMELEDHDRYEYCFVTPEQLYYLIKLI